MEIMYIFATGIMLVILLAVVGGNSIYFLLVKQYVHSKVTLIYKLNVTKEPCLVLKELF